MLGDPKQIIFDSRYFGVDAGTRLLDSAGFRGEPAGLDSLYTAGKCLGQGGPAAPTIHKAGNPMGARRTARSILRFPLATTADLKFIGNPALFPDGSASD